MNTTHPPSGTALSSSTAPAGSPVPAPLPSAAPAPQSETLLQVLGALLIAQGVIRLGFVVNNLLIVPTSVLREQPYILAVSVVLPAVLALASIAAGILMVLCSPTARNVGIAVCSICLVFQLYGFGNGLYLAAVTPGLVLPWTFWLFGPVYSTLFIACIVSLARWRPAYRPLFQP